ncbi:MAG TPA: crosslink repair DNA glycosylase YcaQ family protein [Pseudonocardiaceae bacterium]|nr:crosslink repair DNA glycosylase YcaQ family protein [Pseudonocardiaceae bacterium]
MTDIATLRAWWAHRQALDGRFAGVTAADTLAATGWARSVGGAAPYLGLFARAGLSREQVDAAVAALAVHELPSARDCTYVLPAADYAVGLTVGAGAPEAEAAAAAKHLDVPADEVARLCAAVVEALGDTPMDPAAIRAATGDAVRELGDAGRKRGVSTTLPLALGLLQARGEIRRVPVNGRLDQQRYGYVRWTNGPSPLDPATADVELARRYFRWAGPASLKHFRWFSGFTATRAKAAIGQLELVAVPDTDLLLDAADSDDFAAFTPPTDPYYALVAGIDGIHLLHRDLVRLLDPADAARPVPAGKPGRTLGDEADPPTPVIVDRGRIVGLWEYDPAAGEIAHQLFVKQDKALRAAIESTQDYVREQLGDVRSFGPDSPASRAPRIAALRG